MTNFSCDPLARLKPFAAGEEWRAKIMTFLFWLRGTSVHDGYEFLYNDLSWIWGLWMFTGLAWYILRWGPRACCHPFLICTCRLWTGSTWWLVRLGPASGSLGSRSVRQRLLQPKLCSSGFNFCYHGFNGFSTLPPLMHIFELSPCSISHRKFFLLNLNRQPGNLNIFQVH